MDSTMYEGRKKTLALMALVLLVAATAWARGAGDRPGNRVSMAGSGTMVTREFDITGFDAISAGFAFVTLIRQGETSGIAVSLDDNLVDYLRLEKRGGTLEIGFDPAYAYSVTGATMRVELSMPDLRALAASGSAGYILEGFRATGKVVIDLSGSSRVVGTLDAPELTVHLSGSSAADLRGTAGELTVAASGSSAADLTGLEVVHALVDANGSSFVAVTVGGRLDASASGTSRVLYAGDPTLGAIEQRPGSTVEQIGESVAGATAEDGGTR